MAFAQKARLKCLLFHCSNETCLGVETILRIVNLIESSLWVHENVALMFLQVVTGKYPLAAFK